MAKTYPYINGICQAIDRCPEFVKTLIRENKLSQPPFVLIQPVHTVGDYNCSIDPATGERRMVIEFVTTAEKRNIKWFDVCDWDGTHSSKPNEVRYFMFASPDVKLAWFGRIKETDIAGRHTDYAVVNG